jgi:hypothetical protein
MADTINISNIDALNDKIKNLSNDTVKLRQTFGEINKETDLFGKGFEKIVNEARNNNSLAEKYLVSQKLQESVSAKINEIKQKSSYLDTVGVELKREEVELQNNIAKKQMASLQASSLDADVKKRAIDALTEQMILRDAEMEFYEYENKKVSEILDKLNLQRNTIEGFSPELRQNNTLASTFSNILGSELSTSLKSGIDQLGDLGKHLSELRFPNWTDVLKKGLTNFLEYDKAAFGLRKNMGLLRGDFDILQNNTKTLGVELQDLGISFEQVAASTSAIASEFNMFVASSKDLVKDISVISAQLGIAEADSVKFLKTMSSIGNTTVASQKGMVGFAKSMANAAGVPLPAVMKDIAEASDDVRIFTGKSVDNLIKGAVEARQMGTTLQNMANSAKKMLDFQTSIADEMEASVLLGKDVNFEQARNLAYRKNIVGANQEILNVAKKINFDAMDPYQAEAFAKASGKSVQELQEMLQADKEMEHIRINGTVEQKAQLEKMEQMKRMRSDEAKDLGKMAEQRLREQANQERTVALQNQFNKLMSELAQPVMDVVEPLLDVAVKILPVILKTFKALVTFGGILAFTGTAIAAPWLFIIKPINAVVNAFRNASSSLSTGAKLMEAFSAGGISIGRSFGFIGKVFNIFGKFGRFLGPLGLVITAFQFISNLMKRFNEFVGKDGLILGGLKAIGYALKDTLVQPFIDAYNWVASFWGGNSPSELGLRILDGIKSVGGMILDALTLPFRTAFNFVSDLFGGPKLPKMSDVVFGGKTETTGGTASGSDLGTIIAEGNKQVVAKLDELITLMSTGGIAVNIDGSKASMLLARAQKERGAFGAI